MQTTINTFDYSTHPIGEEEIRVIDIQPDTEHKPLNCNLVTLKRASKDSFKALSYAWGDPAKTHLIQLNGQDFWIHRSLHDALLHIRREQSIVRLWTDAICVNQDDVLERNAQVQRMGETFAEAEEVLIWLGNSPMASHSLDDIRHITERYDTDNDSILTKAEAIFYAASIRDVFSRAWFRRLWVFQEAALARKATVMLGHQNCDLDLLLKFHPVATGVELVKEDKPRLTLEVVDPTAYEEGGIGTAMRDLLFLAEARKWRIRKNREWEQWDFIYTCRGMLCSDPRDDVFATTGFMQLAGMQHIKVDYSLSTAEVLQQAMEHCLSGGYRALVLLHANGNDLSTKDLPSWVPDLRCLEQASMLHPQIYVPGAGGAHWCNPPFWVGDKILVLPGYTFDCVIRHSHERLNLFHRDHRERLEAFEGRILDMGKLSSPYGDYGNRLQAFWRTLVANSWYDYQPKRVGEYSQEDNGAGYEVWMGRAMPYVAGHGTGNSQQSREEATPKFVLRFLRSSETLQHRAFFMTKEGYYGLGPKRIQLGDQVIVVPGLSIPLVVREQPERGTYRFIGVAYVHGIMHGEFVEELQKLGKTSQADSFYIA